MFRFLNKSEPCNMYKQKFDKHIFCFKYCTSHLRYKSLYHILGLDSTATTKEIKSAYYKLSLQFHPDKNNGSEESIAKFRELTEAYEVLSNPEKKKKYDNDYSFQPQYSSRYGQTERYSRARNRSTGYQTYTGKTKDFDYDEHFRKHYRDFEKQQEVEREYFRRRWEADFYRRYPNARDYYRNRHNYTDEQNFEELSNRLKSRKYVYIPVFGVWILLILISAFDSFNSPDRRSVGHYPLYYKVDSKNDRSETKENE